MQTRYILSGAFCLALFAASGIASAAGLNNADRQFMIMAAKADMTEAHEGQMAESQASRADVKDFAKTMVEDHTESYQHLSELAAKLGVSVPNGIDTAKDATIQRLSHLKGKSFDAAFDRDEIAAHQRAIAAFKREAAHGQNADVRDFAKTTIPVLEKHLHLAEQCAKPVKSS